MSYDGIETGKPYYLTCGDQGVAGEIESRWEWIKLTGQYGDHGDPVVFHQQGDGYVIEQTKRHWDNYMFWQAAGGICLNQVNESSQWFVQPATNGKIVLSVKHFGDDLQVHRESSLSGTQWLKAYQHEQDHGRYGHGVSETPILEFTLVPA